MSIHQPRLSTQHYAISRKTSHGVATETQGKKITFRFFRTINIFYLFELVPSQHWVLGGGGHSTNSLPFLPFLYSLRSEDKFRSGGTPGIYTGWALSRMTTKLWLLLLGPSTEACFPAPKYKCTWQCFGHEWINSWAGLFRGWSIFLVEFLWISY